MKQLWKRNAVVGTILVFVCAAIFLNGKYAEKVDKPTKVLGQSELVSTDGDAAEVSANAEGKDYFASARLTRQQARDSALGDSIAARTPAGWVDKANSLGLSVHSDVQTALRDGVPFPDSVTLYGENSAALGAYIVQELGIAEENQLWIEPK